MAARRMKEPKKNKRPGVLFQALKPKRTMPQRARIIANIRDIQAHLQARKPKDVIIRAFLSLRPGPITPRVTLADARMLLEICAGLKKPGGKARLQRMYRRDLVNFIENYNASLQWVLLPPGKRKQWFRMLTVRRALHAPKSSLTGKEIGTFFRRNMVDLVFAVDPWRKSKLGIKPQAYGLALGKHLKSSAGRNKTFYVLQTLRTVRPGTTASIIIGNLRDAKDWIRAGLIMGKDIMKVEITGSKNKLVFSRK